MCTISNQSSIYPSTLSPKNESTSESKTPVITNHCHAPLHEHIILDVVLKCPSFEHRTYAMLDCGAQASYIDHFFAKSLNLNLRQKATPVNLFTVDGSPIVTGPVTMECDISLKINDHVEDITLDVTKLGHYPVILGIPWLKTHDPQVVWSKNHLLFTSDFCIKNCLSHSPVVHALAEHPCTKFVSQSAAVPNSFCPFVNDSQFPTCSPVSIAISASGSIQSSEDIENSGSVSSAINANCTVPVKYHDFLDVFSEVEANSLPTHGPHDHHIPIVEGKSPPFGPIYSLSQTELEVLSDYLKENLKKGFIRPSTSPAGAPILFVKKKDGSLRLCVDYRGLNKVTIKNRYPLPLINELLDRLSSASIFTKLDIRNAYHRVRIAAGDEWKTAFRTRYGHFEYLVMPFGLTNAPASFQSYINDTLREFLDVFVVVYLDDILIFSSDPKEHTKHVKLVLEKLRGSGLFVKAEKCDFDASNVEFLGYCVGPNGISMDKKKIESIVSWPTPKSVHDVQVFLGFANFYRRFIQSYSVIVTPLTSLLKKHVGFNWSTDAEESFLKLKKAFSSSPLLSLFDPKLPCIIESDASDFAIASVLSQVYTDGEARPIAFYSRKLLPSEVNYDVHDKELLAIVSSFKNWRHYLEGSPHIIDVFTDHRNLESFTSSKQLNRRQARWSQILSGYSFVIKYRPGSQNARADALSRRPDFAFHGGENDDKQPIKRIIQGEQKILAQVQCQIPIVNEVLSFKILSDQNLLTRFQQLYEKDPEVHRLKSYIKNPKSIPKRLSHRMKRYRFDSESKLLFYDNRVLVPDDNPLKLDIIKEFHDSPLSGHPGRIKTLELLSRYYFWPKAPKLRPSLCIQLSCLFES